MDKFKFCNNKSQVNNEKKRLASIFTRIDDKLIRLWGDDEIEANAKKRMDEIKNSKKRSPN